MHGLGRLGSRKVGNVVYKVGHGRTRVVSRVSAPMMMHEVSIISYTIRIKLGIPSVCPVWYWNGIHHFWYETIP